MGDIFHKIKQRVKNLSGQPLVIPTDDEIRERRLQIIAAGSLYKNRNGRASKAVSSDSESSIESV